MKICYNGFLYESINRQLIFYHRTNYIKNISSIGIKGILPELNSSALYGKGLYGTTTLGSQFGDFNNNSKKNMESQYGKYITKLRTITDGLLIMNPRLDASITVGSVWDTIVSKIPEESIDLQFLVRFCDAFIGDPDFKGILYDLENNETIKEVKRINTLKYEINKHKNDKISDLLGGDIDKTDKLFSINEFVLYLKKVKLLDNFIGFCLYGSNDGDVIVLHRGAVVTPISYSNASPKSIDSIVWKTVTKAVKNVTKSLVNSTINSKGDDSITFQDLINAYDKMDIDEFKKIANEHPDYLDKLYNSRSWLSNAVIGGEAIFDGQLIDYLNSKNKIDSELINVCVGNPYFDISVDNFNKIIDLEHNGKYITNFKELPITTELFWDLIISHKDIIDKLLDRGCPLIASHNNVFALRIFQSKGMYSEINKAMANNGPNMEQIYEVISYAANPNNKLNIKEFPVLETNEFKNALINFPRYFDLKRATFDIISTYNRIKIAASINPEIFNHEAYTDFILKIITQLYPSSTIQYVEDLISACGTSIEKEISSSDLFNKISPKLKHFFIKKYGSNFRIIDKGVSYPPLVYTLMIKDWATIDNLYADSSTDLNALSENKMNALGITLAYSSTNSDYKDFLNILLNNSKVVKKVYMDHYHKLDKYKELAKQYGIEII